MRASAMNPAAWAMASGRSPSSSASRAASPSASPATRPCKSATDSARASTSHLNRRGHLGPAAFTARDQHMSAAARQPRSHVSGVGGVIEDEQPPVPCPQLGQHHRPHHLDPGSGLHAAQREPDRSELVADKPGRLGVDPPGQVVGSGETVRVLDRQLRLSTPPIPCSACTTALSAASSRSRTTSSRPSRPVNPGLRAGMFHIRGTFPGGRIPATSGSAADCLAVSTPTGPTVLL